MSYERREPDDPDRHGEPTASAVDAAFAQIVAHWQTRPEWPADDPSRDDPGFDGAPTEEIPAVPPAVPPAAHPAVHRAEPTESAESADDDDDHFVPPEPPPLPRPQPATVGAVLLFAFGVALLVVPDVLGLSDQYGLLLGLLCMTGAIVWLVARLHQGPPTDSGWDDGAQL
jgi:hypothetical protein